MPQASLNSATPGKYLTPFSSIFLDAVRLLAALDVAFTHARAIWFREKENDLIPSHLAHGSVIIFFVLSGYVIAYTTGIKKRTSAEYATARLSRLYSVFLPALLFTVIASLLLLYADPALLKAYSRDNAVLRYIASLFFCNEIWFLSGAPLINGVIWSLSYEFWFYVIFGCWLYRKRNKGWLLLLMVMLIAGPKILLMMPIWILGVLAYALPKADLKKSIRVSLIVISLSLSITLMLVLPQYPYPLNASILYWASPFISDFAAALCIAFAFWLLPVKDSPAVIRNNGINKFRKIADLTFPIYVFHYPCLVLCRSFIYNGDKAYLTMYASLIITLVSCFVIGHYTERWQLKASLFFRNVFNSMPLKFVLSIKNRLMAGNT